MTMSQEKSGLKGINYFSSDDIDSEAAVREYKLQKGETSPRKKILEGPLFKK